MNFGLSPEQDMVVQTVRGFVEKELYPHEEAVERSGEAPPELGESIKRKVIDLGTPPTCPPKWAAAGWIT